MKKIIPIIALSTAGLILTGCANSMINTTNDYKQNILDFEKNITTCTAVETNAISQNVLDKYVATLEETENNEVTESYENTENNITLESIENNDENMESLDEELPEEENDNTLTESDITDNDNAADFSTLYSINNDINESCDDFCELKEKITEAILETQSLIEKIQNKELELTREQRMLLNDQAMQLTNLSKQLIQSTNELSFSLSELNYMLQNNENTDDISLKSLIVLNNLINRNNMLFNGLSSLNMINSILHEPFSSGQILYGYQHNNEPPTIKEYSINEDGSITENENQTNQKETVNTTVSSNNSEEKRSNIDTFAERKLKSNIDTYGNFNKTNIDTFFNTALLDNEFMYGNSGFNGMYPYMAQNTYNNATFNQQNANTLSSDNINNNTPENEQRHITKDIQEQDRTQKKSLFAKNVDTYKKTNSSSLNSGFKALKNSVSSFFSRFKTNKDIEFPIENKTLENK